jgi:Ni/Co efflux regulator RcnB
MTKIRIDRVMAALVLGAGLAVVAPAARAQHDREGGGHGAPARAPAPMRAPEPERAPRGYDRVERPAGAEMRPQQINRQAYNHNFTASRGYHIGPYHAPGGFRYQRWSYGERLPRIYWGQQYWLTDYWLFGLDVPPVGYEWVRYGPDALLIDTTTGEVVQTVYGRFL